LKLHLGLTPWNYRDLSARSLCDQATFAESRGYDSIWLPENHFGENALPDPLTLLAAIAGATSTIRLGTTSYLLTLRSPLLAAEQVAVLDQLSGGRLILGVGRGYAPEMLKAFQVPQKEKRRIFEWTLGLMRDAWAGKAVCLDGDEEAAIKVFPRPTQLPEPPIWIAAFGPKALAQAGSLGLPYLGSPMESLATLEENYVQYRAAAKAAGVKLPSAVPLMRMVFVSENRNRVEEIRRLLEDRTENGRLKDGESIDDWTIVGTPDEVCARIDEYKDRLGMTHMIATRLRIAGIPEEMLRESVALLAHELGGR